MNNFDADITTLIEDKHLSGIDFRYDYAINNFKIFLSENNITETVLTRELVESWICSIKDKKAKTLSNYKIFIRQLALSMIKYGKEAYVLPSSKLKRKSDFVPHIYSQEEIEIFFTNVYKLENNNYYPQKNHMFPVIYKLTYCCGLRNSEARNIKLANIDLQEKSILIENSKNHHNRIIYYGDDIAKEIERLYYYNNGFSEYLFHNYKGNKIAMETLLANFRKVWSIADIDSKKLGYRIHDFRHTFAVENLNKCFQNGEDCNAFLPILMTYMGHTSLKSTEYYLRLTNNIFPIFNDKVKKELGSIIPNIKDAVYD